MSADDNQFRAEGLCLLTNATLISRSPMVLTADMNGEILMMSIDSGAYFTLNGAASEIWRLLDSPCSFGKLIDQLIVEYEVPREILAEDVQDLLNRMAAEHIVKLSGS